MLLVVVVVVVAFLLLMRTESQTRAKKKKVKGRRTQSEQEDHERKVKRKKTDLLLKERKESGTTLKIRYRQEKAVALIYWGDAVQMASRRRGSSSLFLCVCVFVGRLRRKQLQIGRKTHHLPPGCNPNLESSVAEKDG